jgi:hypothetical protein
MFREIGALLIVLGIVVIILGFWMDWGEKAIFGGAASLVAGAIIYKLLEN